MLAATGLASQRLHGRRVARASRTIHKLYKHKQYWADEVAPEALGYCKSRGSRCPRVGHRLGRLARQGCRAGMVAMCAGLYSGGSVGQRGARRGRAWQEGMLHKQAVRRTTDSPLIVLEANGTGSEERHRAGRARDGHSPPCRLHRQRRQGAQWPCMFSYGKAQALLSCNRPVEGRLLP